MRTAPMTATAMAILVIAGCASPSGIQASGRVDDVTITVTTPLIASPQLNLDAGFATNGARTQAKQAIPGALRVTSAVSVGQSVHAGDVLVRFDTALLDAALAQAETDLAVAAAQPAVLTDRLAKASDKHRELADKRDELRAARDELAKAQASLEDALTKLPAAQTQLRTAIDDLTTKHVTIVAGSTQAQAALDALPADSTDPQVIARRAALATTLAEARTALSQVDAARTAARGKLSDVTTNLATATKALATVRTKQTQVRDGLSAIDDGLAKLADARSQLTAAKAQADIAVRAAEIARDAAAQRRDLATVLATADGIVVAAPSPGDVLLPGTPTVVVRQDATQVTVWVENANAICTGAQAQLVTDTTSAVTASVAHIGAKAVPPPSSYAAHGLHATRAVPITLALTAPLPAGLPATASITPCH